MRLRHNFYLDIVNLLLKGLNPSQISRQLGISKQLVNYHISSLKRNNLIRKVAYGTWETDNEKLVKLIPKDTSVYITSDSVRGHSFVFKIKIKNLKNWDKRVEILKELNIPYEMIGINRKTPRIEFKGHKVWLCSNCLIIYYPEGKSYFKDTSTEAYNHAIYDMEQLVIGLEGLLRANFRVNGNYIFKVSKSHYSLVKNSLAYQYNKEGKKLNVYDSGGLWLVIDNSFQLNELETQGKTALPSNLIVQNFFNDLKQNPATMGEMKELMIGFSHNLVTHFEVLNKIAEAIKELKEVLKK